MNGIVLQFHYHFSESQKIQHIYELAGTFCRTYIHIHTQGLKQIYVNKNLTAVSAWQQVIKRGINTIENP